MPFLAPGVKAIFYDRFLWRRYQKMKETQQGSKLLKVLVPRSFAEHSSGCFGSSLLFSQNAFQLDFP
jgi:hypothetical protein